MELALCLPLLLLLVFALWELGRLIPVQAAVVVAADEAARAAAQGTDPTAAALQALRDRLGPRLGAEVHDPQVQVAWTDAQGTPAPGPTAGGRSTTRVTVRVVPWSPLGAGDFVLGGQAQAALP